MHGRKRTEYKALQRDAKVAAKLASKSVAWHQLQAELLERRRATYSAKTSQADATTAAATVTTTLHLIEKAVSVNPDPLWLWNFRSELVLGRTISEQDTTAVVTLDWEREQRVTQAALQANPKSYGAWHYRKRCLQQHLLLLPRNKSITTPTLDPAAAVLEQELELTSLFFQRDERNFHCWSYRRFVVSCCLWSTTHSSRAAATAEPSTAPPPPVGEWRLDDDGKLWMGAQISSSSSSTPDTPDSCGETTRSPEKDERVTAILEKEWAFTEDKIRDNFSNFSAFHYRSKLLPVLVERRSSPEQHSSSLSEIMTTMVASELELVLNAVFTEPDDQTAWWYQRFLLDFVKSSSSSSPSHSGGGIAAVAVNAFKDILQLHVDQLRELQAEYPTGKWVLTGVLQCLQHGSGSSLQENTVAERCRILEELIAIDPDRTRRYQHLLRQTQKEVVEGS